MLHTVSAVEELKRAKVLRSVQKHPVSFFKLCYDLFTHWPQKTIKKQLKNKKTRHTCKLLHTAPLRLHTLLCCEYSIFNSIKIFTQVLVLYFYLCFNDFFFLRCISLFASQFITILFPPLMPLKLPAFSINYILPPQCWHIAFTSLLGGQHCT